MASLTTKELDRREALGESVADACLVAKHIHREAQLLYRRVAATDPTCQAVGEFAARIEDAVAELQKELEGIR